MERFVQIVLVMLLVNSCGLSKEMRRSNNAVDHIEKAKRKDPSIVRGREIEIPVKIKTQEKLALFDFNIKPVTNPESLISLIEKDLNQAPRIIREVVNLPCALEEEPFENGDFKGTVSIKNGVLRVDVMSKADSVSGNVKVMTDVIKPTQYDKRSIFAKLSDQILQITYLIIAFVLGAVVGKLFLK